MSKDSGKFDVATFRAAAPYINTHRNQIVVIAFDGEAVEDSTFPALIHDIALLHSLGMKLVLVHGARPQIERRLKSAGMGFRYRNTLRITDSTALAAVKEAVGCVRVEIEALLSLGLVNTPMSGMRLRVSSGNFVTARPLGILDGIDFGHTGEVRKVDAEAIKSLLGLANIVLLSPLGYSPTGETFNLSAIDVATMAATALQANKLIFLHGEAGLRDSRRQLIQQLTLAEAQSLLSGKRKLPDRLNRLLHAAIHACINQVQRIHLINRTIDGALLREMFTRDGVGVMITSDAYEGLRQAQIKDVGGILELITPLEQQDILVRRSREQLELEIRHFEICERDGMIIGCAGLYPFPDEGLAELACLAVHQDYQHEGRGDSLLNRVEQKVRNQGLKQLFVLTTRTAHWFRERGFNKGDLKALPVKRRELYNYQRNSKVYFKTLT